MEQIDILIGHSFDNNSFELINFQKYNFIASISSIIILKLFRNPTEIIQRIFLTIIQRILYYCFRK